MKFNQNNKIQGYITSIHNNTGLCNIEISGLIVDIKKINELTFKKFKEDSRFNHDKIANPVITRVSISSSSNDINKDGIFITSYLNINKGDDIKYVINMSLAEFAQFIL